MSLKAKLWFAAISLTVLVVLIVGLALIMTARLSASKEEVLVDNIRSLDYMQKVINLSPYLNQSDSVKKMQALAQLEQANITEVGEQMLADSLTISINSAAIDQTTVRELATRIHQLNLNAIVRKDINAEAKANQTIQIMSLAATLTILILLVFIFNFPGSILGPIKEHTERMQAIAAGNYQQVAPVTDEYELGQLARAFNQMVTELVRFRNSNLAEVIYEKTRYESVINALNDPLLIFNAEGILVSANRFALKAYFYNGDNVLFKDQGTLAAESMLVAKHWDLLHQNAFSHELVIDVVIEREIRHFTPDGFVVNGLDPRDNTDKLMGYVLILRDVTSVKSLELAKSEFLALISHELKTPLSAINLSLNLLSKEKDTIQRAQLIDHIAVENRRMLKLVNDVLVLSRLETQQQLNQLDSFLVFDALQEVLAEQQIMLMDRGLDIQVNGEGHIINTSRESFKLAVANLLSNAIKYAIESSVIRIALSSSGLTVSNEVAQDVLGQRGAGLGLKLVEQLAGRYGWEFSFNIQEGVATARLEA